MTNQPDVSRPPGQSSPGLVRPAGLLYLFSAPLDSVPLPIGTPTSVAGALFVFVWGIALLRGQVRIAHAARIWTVSALLVGWSLLTVLWSAYPPASLAQSSSTLLLVLSTVALSGIFSDDPAAPSALALGATVASIATLLSGPQRLYYGAGTSVIGEQSTFLDIDQNALAFHLVLGLAVSLYLALKSRPGLLRLTVIGMALIQTVTLIFVGSRTGAGALLATWFVFAVLAAKRRAVGVGVVATAAAASSLVVLLLAGSVPERVQQWLENPTLSDSRAGIIDQYLAFQSDWVVQGVGAGADAYFLLSHAGWFKNAHSAFWKIWIELGFVGLLLWGALLLGIVIRAWHSNGRPLLLMTAVPVLAFFVTLGPINSNMLWAVFGLLIGASPLASTRSTAQEAPEDAVASNVKGRDAPFRTGSGAHK